MTRPADTQDIVTGTPPPSGSVSAEEPPLLPGVKLGQYKIVKKLGEGGMGRVYLAEHVVIGRRVALKVLRRSLADNPLSVERFFSEAHAVNRIRHAGIVVVTDLFVAEQMPCIVMELLEGKTLAQEVAQCGPLSAERVLAIGAQIASALEAVHAAGIIHRDLKPDNIFLLDEILDVAPGVRERRVKILDFGVAKLGTTSLGVGGGRTIAGAIIGTPEYMAPEQLAGKPVDLRADIYALGVLLFFAATGKPPFTGDSFGELVVKHLSVPPPTLRALVPAMPRALERALATMLEKEPDARPQSVADAAALLRAPEPPPEPKAVPRPAKAAIAAGAVLVVIVVAVVAVVLGRAQGPDVAAQTPAPAPAAPVEPHVAAAHVEPTADGQPAAGQIEAARIDAARIDGAPIESGGVAGEPATGEPAAAAASTTPSTAAKAHAAPPPKPAATAAKKQPKPAAATTTKPAEPAKAAEPKPVEKRGVIDPFAQGSP